MLLIHISDLHLSRYGERGTWSMRNGEEETDWETLHAWQRWQVEGSRDKRGRPDRLRLVDPEEVVHVVQKWPSKSGDKAIGSLLSFAMKRHMTSAEQLINERPNSEDLAALLKVDPGNSNLRFLQLLDEIGPLEPAIIALTGDTTDNGFGYRLVEHYFARWIKEKRLFVIPGNHDTYDMFPGNNRRARLERKERGYREFAERVDNAPDESGAYVRYVDDIAIVGLSSCKPPSIRILNASGEVSAPQLKWMESLAEDPTFSQARHRLALVHHHVLKMPFELGGRNPIEMGMRMRNAPALLQSCVKAGIGMLFNGHRHHGYTVMRPGFPMVVSSPSSTLGCKSTDMRYLWKMDLSQRKPYPELHLLSGESAYSSNTPPPPE